VKGTRQVELSENKFFWKEISKEVNKFISLRRQQGWGRRGRSMWQQFPVI